MMTFRTKREIRDALARARAEGKTVGVVPTMGALHEGHMSLVKRSVQDNDFTVVTVFVNPAQFGPAEDLAKYPRQLDSDEKMCREAGVDAVFAPEASEMYAGDSSTFVEETALSKGLCGASRPGHFRGVTTVVVKLLNIVDADRAYFGQKDAQQVAVVKRMVRDLDIPVEVVTLPIVREPDGLAMSSRNKYLSGTLRSEALVLSEALAKTEALFAEGQRDAAALKTAMREVIETAPNSKIDYVEIVDAEDLRPVESIEAKALVALAVFIGETRLIDNILLAP